LVMRSDGRFFGYRELNDTASSGALVAINTDTQVQANLVTSVGNDNIQHPAGGTVFQVTQNSPTNVGNTARLFADLTQDFDASVDAREFETAALTFFRRNDNPDYYLYYAVTEVDDRGRGAERVNSKLYRGRTDGSAAPDRGTDGYGVKGDIQPGGVTFASRTYTFDSDAAANPTESSVRIESKIPGAAGSVTSLTFLVADGNSLSVSVNPTTRVITVTMDDNTVTAAAFVDAINGNADARTLVTAAVVVGPTDANNTAGNVDFSAGPLGSGANGVPNAVAGLNGPITGRVTGLAFNNYHSGSLFGVTDTGELLIIDRDSGTVSKRINFAAALPGGYSTSFEGLTLGPQNVQNGAYANYLFAITKDGYLYAINSTAVAATDASNTTAVRALLMSIFDTDNDGLANTQDLAPADGIIDGVRVQITGAGTITDTTTRFTGLAFSPVDFNLWHPTTRRATDSGHGVNDAPDNSRSPGGQDTDITNPGSSAVDRDSDEGQGGASMYFGFEQQQTVFTENTQSYLTYTAANAQYGVRTTAIQNDLSSNPELRNRYNFSGGAAGALQTDSFSLAGYAIADRPTLYFNYWLGSEAHAGSDVTTDVTDPFRDAARVYISSDGGLNWNLLATNNSELSGADPSVGTQTAELAGFLSHLSDAGLNSSTPRSRSQQVRQELFDTGTWRQARVDLSDYANLSNLRLRFDFSTAGAFDTFSLQANGLPSSINGSFGETTHTQRSVRSYANTSEGFYIDDIIVGFSERGEMATGAAINSVVSDLNSGRTNDPDGPPNGNGYFDNLSGEYQVEIRRSGEYAALGDQGPIAISTTYDTNDRHIIEPDNTLTRCQDFETVLTLCGNALPVTDTVPLTTAWNTASTVNPQTGTRSAQAGTISHDGFATMRMALTGLTAGSITFTYAVEAEDDSDGLRFSIDGNLQKIASRGSEGVTPIDETLASGVIPYQRVTYFFGAGDHTFIWAYTKDGAGSFGRDTAWVDNIILLQGASGLPGDQNILREQGQLIIDSNTISHASNFGINVQAGSRTESNSLPHPGSQINFPQLNTDEFAPGVVIRNNVVVGGTAGNGIRFAGDPP
ncbi:MAG: hypothetical protein HYV60_18890, partial [Planctomycetia bacterium]|nr:hypothetical protein [Planctomycetia bacterium]